MGSDAARILGVERADWPMAGAGCVLAIGLSVAAGTMILRGDHRPQVNGADHLALFARPAQLHDERMRALSLPPLPTPPEPAASAVAPEPVPVATRTIDYVPTASITPPAPALPAQARATPDYVLLKASRGRATFRGPSGEMTVRKGDIVPGLGRVGAIAFKNKAWTVVLDGTIQTRR